MSMDIIGYNILSIIGVVLGCIYISNGDWIYLLLAIGSFSVGGAFYNNYAKRKLAIEEVEINEPYN